MSQGLKSSSNILVRQLFVTEDFPARMELAESEIHVWQRHRDPVAGELARLKALLSDIELARAGRFRFDVHRNEFVVSRGTLRLLLGSYLGCSPTDLQLQYTQFGRPKLAGLHADAGVDFNVSHSDRVILWGFARRRRLGVDVERSRRDFNTLEIAERFFSAAERKTLRSLPAEQRHDAFFRCWTRKESFIKALGEGLSHPLDQFDVTLAPDEPAVLLATRPDASDVNKWMLWDIHLSDDYAAALAT